MLEEQKLSALLISRLNLGLPLVRPRGFMKKWKQLVSRQENLRQDVSIALVGKYTQLSDAYASVIKALDHAALACQRRLRLVCIEAEDLEDSAKTERPVKYHEAWQNVCKSHGLLVPGGFGKRGLEGKVLVCRWARLNKKPFLGICLGLQAAVIEFARNVLNMEGATSQEVADEDSSGPYAIIEMLEHNPGQMGGTMRLGTKKTIFVTQKSKLRQLYGNVDFVKERHRHRYEVDPRLVRALEDAGLHFVGQDEERERMEILELEDHPPLKASPPFLGLILASIGKLDNYLRRECRMSPTDSPDSTDDESQMPLYARRDLRVPPVQGRTPSSVEAQLTNPDDNGDLRFPLLPDTEDLEYTNAAIISAASRMDALSVSRHNGACSASSTSEGSESELTR
ncbi:hypothetical protein HAZT_HAZT003424 [Hyalella azteca]|uniref:CTP synthase (glutamine hydrolyzing) n=1 Tax=Hyalella azteca TaxID=294128 RepID=A0A6A0GTN6_HYAAZ|nr:hypothetical protein HAZT_HAZT003424 [Hyalella azteca]